MGPPQSWQLPYSPCGSDEEVKNIVKFLLDSGADVNEEADCGPPPYMGLVSTCVWKRFDSYWIAAQNWKPTTLMGYTPLIFAAKSRGDHMKVVKLLLDRGAKVNVAQSESGITALHWACLRGKLETVRLLLDHSAVLEAKTEDNETPLHWACSSDSENNLVVVKELVRRGADVYCKDENQKTPFDEACYEENEAVSEFLLEQYTEKVRERAGHLLIHAILGEAVYLENDDKVQVPIGTLTVYELLGLLGSIYSRDPASIRSQDRNGDLPLHIVCRTNAPIKVLRFFVMQDVSTQDLSPLYAVNHAGSLPIHEACRGGASLAKIKFLVKKGGVRTLDARDNQNALPIHEVCRGGASLTNIKFLVKKGGVGTLDARDNQHALPLHVLCQSDPSVDVVKFLLKLHPSSISEETNAGALPFMLACEWSASESVLQVLLTKHPEALAAMETYLQSVGANVT